jgi:hypothetical protein
LIEWARERPTVQIAVKVRNGKHPFVKAEYVTSAVRGGGAGGFPGPAGGGSRPNTMPVIHQICLKSSSSSSTKAKRHKPKDLPQLETDDGRNSSVETVLQKLYNKSGRKMTKFTQPVYTQTPSVQGVWTPSLNLQLQDKFPMKMVEN